MTGTTVLKQLALAYLWFTRRQSNFVF